MSEQTNVKQMSDGYYDQYYNYNSYNYTADYIIWGSIAGAVIIGVAMAFYFMIKRKQNRARRAQLSAGFLARNQFQPGTTGHHAPNTVAGQGLQPPAYAYYPPQGQQVYAIPAQPGILTGSGYQYQPTYPPTYQAGSSVPVQQTRN